MRCFFTAKTPRRRKGREGTEMYRPTEHEEQIGKLVVDAVFKVHSRLGPGLLESTYEVCLAHELDTRGVPFDRQSSIPIRYEGLTVEDAYRIDMLVHDSVIVEIKAVEKTLPVHHAQLLTYLKLSQRHLGFLINFNVARIRDGIRRFVL